MNMQIGNMAAGIGAAIIAAATESRCGVTVTGANAR
jgi:hypothetical protein